MGCAATAVCGTEHGLCGYAVSVGACGDRRHDVLRTPHRLVPPYAMLGTRVLYDATALVVPRDVRVPAPDEAFPPPAQVPGAVPR
eukprot:3517536-Rhodomonas_salina.2